jgi:hypothetical protein
VASFMVSTNPPPDDAAAGAVVPRYVACPTDCPAAYAANGAGLMLMAPATIGKAAANVANLCLNKASLLDIAGLLGPRCR